MAPMEPPWEWGRTVVGGQTAGLTPPRPPDAAHRGSAWRPGKAFHASGSEGQRGSPLKALEKQTVAGHSTPAARRCVATDAAVQGSQWTPVGRRTGLGPPHCRYPQPQNATGSLLQLLELHICHIALCLLQAADPAGTDVGSIKTWGTNDPDSETPSAGRCV